MSSPNSREMCPAVNNAKKLKNRSVSVTRLSSVKDLGNFPAKKGKTLNPMKSDTMTKISSSRTPQAMRHRSVRPVLKNHFTKISKKRWINDEINFN